MPLPPFQSTRPRGARLVCLNSSAHAKRFQSTRPRGARRRGFQHTSCYRCFNPRARVGRDVDHRTLLTDVVGFNPRARVGRDPRPCPQISCQSGFNPRARVGRDLLKIVFFTQCQVKFQSTRPRGARRRCSVCHMETGHVSIHAPAWGATAFARFCFSPRSVSIHAPAWGATRVKSSGPVKLSLFQSTRPRGARLPLTDRSVSLKKVSIHAPAWGATIFTEKTLVSSYVSIHAPAWGATPSKNSAISPKNGFNPRARVGRDFCSKSVNFIPIRFNPRARVGRDFRNRPGKREKICFNPRARVGRDIN